MTVERYLARPVSLVRDQGLAEECLRSGNASIRAKQEI
jgi:hypothetical protein